MSMRHRGLVTFGAGCVLALLAAGAAVAGCTTDADCEDGNPCTKNTCSNRGRCRSPQLLDAPEFPCFVDQPPGPCSVDVCTATAACKRVPKCNDANPCTDDSCDAYGACSYVTSADGSSCSADACDSPGTCQGGVCVGAPCDDGLPCTDDACGSNGQCVHPDKPVGTPCGPDHNDCKVLSCNGHGACEAKPAAENATCLNPSSVCYPWGLCKGTSQSRSCQLNPGACQSGEPCVTDGLDCSGSTLCGLTSTCAGGRCIDLTCDAGATVEPCGFRCGSDIIGGTCQAMP